MSDAVNDNNGLLHVKSCSICGKPSEQRWRPFCSRRCADVDLHKWLSGSYAIPASPVSDDEEMDAQMIISSQNNPVSVDN